VFVVVVVVECCVVVLVACACGVLCYCMYPVLSVV